MANVIRIIYVLYVFWFFKGDQFENSSKGMRIEIMASTVTGVFLIILSVTVVTVLIKRRLDVVFTTENVITYFISDYLKIQAVVPNFPTVSLGKMYNMWHFFFQSDLLYYKWEMNFWYIFRNFILLQCFKKYKKKIFNFEIVIVKNQVF